jgi:hypothetical protein
MRRRTAQRRLVALGHQPWVPSEEQREMVKMYALNEVPHEKIARILECTLAELHYHFSRELNLGVEELLGWAAGRASWLASQNQDLGVAYRATMHLLQSRKKAWRIPKTEEPEEERQRPVARLTLAETEAEIERILARRAGRGATAGAAPAQGEEAEGED